MGTSATLNRLKNNVTLRLESLVHIYSCALTTPYLRRILIVRIVTIYDWAMNFTRRKHKKKKNETISKNLFQSKNLFIFPIQNSWYDHSRYIYI